MTQLQRSSDFTNEIITLEGTSNVRSNVNSNYRYVEVLFDKYDANKGGAIFHYTISRILGTFATIKTFLKKPSPSSEVLELVAPTDQLNVGDVYMEIVVNVNDLYNTDKTNSAIVGLDVNVVTGVFTNVLGSGSNTTRVTGTVAQITNYDSYIISKQSATDPRFNRTKTLQYLFTKLNIGAYALEIIQRTRHLASTYNKLVLERDPSKNTVTTLGKDFMEPEYIDGTDSLPPVINNKEDDMYPGVVEDGTSDEHLPSLPNLEDKEDKEDKPVEEDKKEETLPVVPLVPAEKVETQEPTKPVENTGAMDKAKFEGLNEDKKKELIIKAIELLTGKNLDNLVVKDKDTGDIVTELNKIPLAVDPDTGKEILDRAEQIKLIRALEVALNMDLTGLELTDPVSGKTLLKIVDEPGVSGADLVPPKAPPKQEGVSEEILNKPEFAPPKPPAEFQEPEYAGGGGTDTAPEKPKEEESTTPLAPLVPAEPIKPEVEANDSAGVEGSDQVEGDTTPVEQEPSVEETPKEEEPTTPEENTGTQEETPKEEETTGTQEETTTPETI